MTQQVSSPPSPKRPSQPLLEKQARTSSAAISLLAFACLLLLLFTSLLIWNVSQVVGHGASTPRRTVRASERNDDDAPLLVPGTATPTKLVLPTDHAVVYEQQNSIYRVSTNGGTPELITTPGYIYNPSVPPLLTPSGQLLYSGDGLWLTDIFDSSTIKQIATLPSGQVITSVILSSDGTTVAWSTEPVDGKGNNMLYAGPLESSVMVYQHDATDCPCYRVFSFLHDAGTTNNTTLLLTDDRGDHHAVHYGLWSLNLSTTPLEDPKPLLDGDAPQGPLALSPSSNVLLYSTYLGAVPEPNDGSVPSDIAALNYANSLSMASVGSTSMSGSHTLLLEQHDLSNNAAYHWITTPIFSADGHTLLYVEFSSDAQAPFDRHSAIYVVHISGSGSHLSVSKPQLLATATTLFTELGAWLNDHILTFYADGTVYALDIQSGAVTTIVQTKAYAHIITVVDSE